MVNVSSYYARKRVYSMHIHVVYYCDGLRYWGGEGVVSVTAGCERLNIQHGVSYYKRNPL